MMKLLAALIILCMTIPPMANAKSCHASSAQGKGNLNCGAQHGQSPQNSQTPTSGLGPSGQTPDPGTTNQHVGMSTLTPAQPIAVVQPVVVPPQPVTVPTATPNPTPSQVPTPIPQATPQVAQQVPQPMNVPTATPMATPQVAQKTPQPMNVPTATPMAIPQVAQKTPQPMNAPTATPMAIPQVAQKTPQPMNAPTATPMATPQVAQRVPQPMNVPTAIPMATPQVAQKTPQPTNVTTQRPANVLSPAKLPMVTPHPNYAHVPHTKPIVSPNSQTLVEPTKQMTKVPQPLPVPVPHLTTGKVEPRPQVVQVPGKTSQTVTGTQISTGATHHILTGNPGGGLGALRISGAILTSEIVEPGIQNQRVELYRSNDAKEVLYQDVIPMDKTGFHLTVIGIRPPNYQYESVVGELGGGA